MPGDSGGVRWWLRLALDKASINKVKRGAQDALNDGTDASAARRNLGVVERGFDRIRGAANRLRGALFTVQGLIAGIGVGIGAGAAVKFLVDTNREFESMIAQLKVLEGSEQGARAVFRAIEDFAQKTPFQIGELVDAYTRLRTAGIQPTEEMLTRFGDLASARGKSIQDFAMAVEDAMTGEMERLKEFGVTARREGNALEVTFNGQTTEIANTQEAIVGYLESLGEADVVQGSMEEQMKTLNGAISNLWDELGTLARTVGEEGGLNDLLREATRTISGMVAEVNAGTSAIPTWIAGFVAVGKTVGGVISFLFNTGQVIGDLLRSTFSLLTGNLLFAIDKAADGLNWLIEQANKLLGVDIDFRLGGVDWETWIADSGASMERMTHNATEARGALTGIADGWVNVAKAAREAAQAQEEASHWGTGGGGGDGGGDGGGTGMPPAVPVATPRMVNSMPTLQGHSLAPVEATEEAAGEFDNFWGGLEQGGVIAAHNLTDAFGGFFEALFTGFEGAEGGFESMGDAAKGIGASIVSGLIEGMAQYHTAMGIGKIAEGGWPPNPVAIKSGLGHLAAAGLFKALGSMLSNATAPSTPSIGAASYGQRVPAATTQQADTTPEVHIYIDPLDPHDPAAQEFVGAAYQYATEAYGTNVRIHPRTGGGG